MLNLINTKILLAILAALTVMGSAMLYQRDQAAKAAAAAARAAEILQLQRDDNEYLKQENEALRKQVEAEKKRHNSAAAHEGNTWKTYLP
jgi:Flp pilus assembly protein TadG